MTSHPDTRDRCAKDAAIERLWTHTIGITNRALAHTGKDPVSGLPAKEWEIPGSGLAGLWGKHHFILTAKHVVEDAAINDMSFFDRPTQSLRTASESELTMNDAFTAVSLAGTDAAIRHCDWEDLALITVQTDHLGPYVEFADIANSWIDPRENELVIAMGYPVSAGVIFERRQGPEIQKAVLLTPTGFSGDVMPSEAGKTFAKFNPERHFLMPFEPAREGKHPKGISGAAAWVQSSEKQIVWTAKFNFAGTYTHSYRNGTVVQVVKASVVRRFLEEMFGPPIDA